MPDAGDRVRARRIIDRIRSYGVEVREMPGHENRGGAFVIVPVKVFDHHDASSRKSGEWGSLGLILDGAPRGIPGPLSNVQVARCLDGVPRIAWVADGTCSHAGTGSGHGLPTNAANPRTYGVEKANDGVGEPYTAAANYATNATFHAMAVESGAIPESFPLGHKEWTARKVDPLYSMSDRRLQVGRFQPSSATPAPAPANLQEEDDMPDALRTPDGTVWLATAIEVWPISDQNLSGAVQKIRGKLTDVSHEYLMALRKSADEYRARRVNEILDAPIPRSDEAGGGVATLRSQIHWEDFNFRTVVPEKVAELVAAPQVDVSEDMLARALGSPEVAAAIGEALVAAQDRRARDGDPATGPVS